jgi:N-dimethylarginine dimethylaminohydrolase
MSDMFSQFNETDTLQKVIIGRYKDYRKVDEYVEIVNKSQKKGLPSLDQLESEFEAFSQILVEHNVEVLTPDYVGKFVYDQLTPRDIGVTIGNKFVICNMAKRSRRYEAAGIFRHILSMEGEEPNILLPPENNMLLEGGDIIIDKGRIFVGITQRTNRAGIEFLSSFFGDEFEVTPVQCDSFDEKEQVLHLDCIFNPVGAGHALIYPQGMKEIPDAITQNYKLIEVDEKAQQFLATNVLSLNQETVISRDHPACRAANEAMREIGLEVITLPFDGAPATGGSFRCCSLPLVRS